MATHSRTWKKVERRFPPSSGPAAKTYCTDLLLVVAEFTLANPEVVEQALRLKRAGSIDRPGTDAEKAA